VHLRLKLLQKGAKQSKTGLTVQDIDPSLDAATEVQSNVGCIKLGKAFAVTTLILQACMMYKATSANYITASESFGITNRYIRNSLSISLD
jgi:hypothetical protein